MTKQPQSNNFFDALADELVSMPDEQVLDGVDPAEVQARAQTCLRAAKAEVAKRRLEAARTGLAAAKAARESNALSGTVVSAVEARRFIATAQNDPRYTLAARNLGELPDEEVLRLYRQMMELREDADKPDCDGTT
jgi:hypothetical protein